MPLLHLGVLNLPQPINLGTRQQHKDQLPKQGPCEFGVCRGASLHYNVVQWTGLGETDSNLYYVILLFIMDFCIYF